MITPTQENKENKRFSLRRTKEFLKRNHFSERVSHAGLGSVYLAGAYMAKGMYDQSSNQFLASLKNIQEFQSVYSSTLNSFSTLALSSTPLTQTNLVEAKESLEKLTQRFFNSRLAFSRDQAGLNLIQEIYVEGNTNHEAHAKAIILQTQNDLSRNYNDLIPASEGTLLGIAGYLGIILGMGFAAGRFYRAIFSPVKK